MMVFPELDLRMLAYGLTDKRTLMSLSNMVSAEYFSRDCQIMWELISRCFTRYKEVPTERVLEMAAGQAWNEGLKAISDAVHATIVDIREYPVDLEQFKVRHNNHLLLRAGEEIFRNNYSDGRFADVEAANRVMRETVAKVERIHRAEVFREGTLSGTADDAWEEYERIEKNPGMAAGIHLGFAEFDRITNGLRPAEVLLIGGQSGTGKSALAMNMAVNAWLGDNKVPEGSAQPSDEFKKGRSIVYFTIEMPFEALRRRLHACVAGVPLYGIRDGTLTGEEKRRYRAALEFMRAYPWHFHVVDIPRGATMRHVESKYMEHCQAHPGHPPELVVIDYITLMKTDDEDSDWLSIGKIAEQLHEFGRVHGVPSISPVQLNRPSKNGQPASRPDQERIARSTMLVDNANIVITIDKRRDEHLEKDMRVHIIKMRDGEQGVLTLQKRLDVMRLLDDVTTWDPADYKEVPDGQGSGQDAQCHL
jgi:replicative DNA helicase